MSDKKARAAFGLQLKREKRINNHRAWRQEHLNAQGHKCLFCRKPLTFEASVLHHIIRISKGGKDEKSNTAATCKKCNKGNT